MSPKYPQRTEVADMNEAVWTTAGRYGFDLSTHDQVLLAQRLTKEPVLNARVVKNAVEATELTAPRGFAGALAKEIARVRRIRARMP